MTPNTSINPAENTPPPVKLFLETNLQIIFGVTLIAVMGVASIAPAFPRMVQQLGVSSSGIGLMITVFTLPGVLLTPVLGILADRYGRKKVLIPSLILFGLSGGGCMLARNFTVLLLLRFLQGMGAASLGSLNATLIGDLYNGKQRTIAMGYNASVLSVGTASYPAIGGALATFGWYFPFLLPLLAIPLGVIVLLWLKNPEPKGPQQLRSQFAGALKSMGNRQVLGLFSACVTTFIILYGPYLTYFPLHLDHAFKASPLVIGLIFTCMSLITAATSSQIGKLIQKYSEKNLLKISFLLYGTALAIVPFIPSIRMFWIPAVIYGLAHGINLPCLHSTLAGMAPMAHRATFMSINGMILRLGQTLGPILAGIAFGLGGMEMVFLAGAGLALLMALLGALLLR